MRKTLSKSGIEGNYLKLKKVIYQKPTVNIILNGKRMNSFLLRSKTRQGSTFSHHSYLT